jgi:ornithine carbamoyltransferase
VRAKGTKDLGAFDSRLCSSGPERRDTSIMTTQASSAASHDAHSARRFGRNHLNAHRPNLLRLGDLTSEDLARLCHLANEFRSHPDRHSKALHGQTVLCWLGAEVPAVADTVARAVNRLGGALVVVNPVDLEPDRVGTIENAGRVLSRLGRVLVLGGLPDDDLARLAKEAAAPVLNVFSDRNDPCQALADLFTVEQSGASLAATTLVYLGRACNVTHDLMEGAALSGMTMVVATPDGGQPDPVVTVQARDVAERRGGRLHLTRRPEDAVAAAGAIVLGPGTIPGARYELTPALLERAAPDVLLLGCQPSLGQDGQARDWDRGLSLDQRDNQLLAYQAVIYALTEGLLKGHHA